jgi:hypothetical protein
MYISKAKNSSKNHVRLAKTPKAIHIQKNYCLLQTSKVQIVMNLNCKLCATKSLYQKPPSFLYNLYKWKLKCCQNIWDKTEVLLGRLGEHIGNLRGTCWEPNGNIVRSIAMWRFFCEFGNLGSPYTMVTQIPHTHLTQHNGLYLAFAMLHQNLVRCS